MKVLCILNPRSGGGLALQRWPQLQELFRAFRLEYERLSPADQPIERQVVERLEAASPSAFDVIAGVGGDGTQSAVINGLMQYRAAHPAATLPPYGFIPMGVGNDIAKSFGLTSRMDFFVDDLRRAVATLVYGADYWLDLGLLNGRYFADAVTIGIDVRILHERNRRKRWMEQVPALRWLAGGRLPYTWATGRGLWRQERITAAVRVDGELWHAGPMLNLLINNTRIYAGDFDFCTDGFGNDGLLDVILFQGRSDYLSRYLLSLRRNPRRIRRMANRLAKASSHTQGRRIDVGLSRVEAAQMDGEELPAANRFEIAVVPRAVHVKVPAEP